MPRHASKPEIGGEVPFATPFGLNGPVTEIASRTGEAWTRACLELQQELTRFASARLEGDMALVRSIAQCRNLADMAKLQSEWAAATVTDYVNEAGELAQIASRAAREGVVTMAEGARKQSAAD